MDNKTLNILKNADLVSGSLQKNAVLKGENMDFSKYEVSHGYGQIVKAGIVVTKGAIATMDVDMTFRTFKEESYKEATHTHDVHTLVCFLSSKIPHFCHEIPHLPIYLKSHKMLSESCA